MTPLKGADQRDRTVTRDVAIVPHRRNRWLGVAAARDEDDGGREAQRPEEPPVPHPATVAQGSAARLRYVRAMRAPPPELPPGTLVGGKLRIVRTLGTGGMGAVYEVQHEITRHHRALKLLHASVRLEHPDLVRRFLREASVAGTLGDPHIVETYDAGDLDTGEPYLLMELLSGESLAARLRRAPLSIAEAVGVVRQICAAMDVAHARGIVHRDLKPDNVFLCAPSTATPTGEGGSPFVKVLDFGISRFADPEEPSARTSEGLVLGTPHYMPPEQTRGVVDLDARADVYALGVIAYEAICGRRPFHATHVAELIVKIHHGGAAPLAEVRAGVPEPLSAAVARAMAVDRDDRFPNAAAFASALAPFVDHVDVSLDHTLPLSPTPAEIAPTEAALERGAAPPTAPSRVPWRWIAGAGVAIGLSAAFMWKTQPPTSPSNAMPTTSSATATSASTSTTASGVASVSSSVPTALSAASASVSVVSSASTSAKSAPSVKPSGSTKSQQAGLDLGGGL